MQKVKIFEQLVKWFIALLFVDKVRFRQIEA